MKLSKSVLSSLSRGICAVLALYIGVSVAHAAVPVITSELEVVAVVGEPFSYQIQAEHGPLGYSVINIPYWLKRDGARLQGTSEQIGKWTMQLLALNADGVSESVELTVQVLNGKATHAPAVFDGKQSVASSISKEDS